MQLPHPSESPVPLPSSLRGLCRPCQQRRAGLQHVPGLHSHAITASPAQRKSEPPEGPCTTPPALSSSLPLSSVPASHTRACSCHLPKDVMPEILYCFLPCLFSLSARLFISTYKYTVISPIFKRFCSSPTIIFLFFFFPSELPAPAEPGLYYL